MIAEIVCMRKRSELQEEKAVVVFWEEAERRQSTRQASAEKLRFVDWDGRLSARGRRAASVYPMAACVCACVCCMWCVC